MLPPWNDPSINPNQLSPVRQNASSSSPNTTHELQASSIPGHTPPNPSNTMPPLSTNNGSRNIYGCMVDVSKLTPAQQQQHSICYFSIITSCVTQMTLHQCLYLHLLFPTLNHCLNRPYHHLIVHHLIKTELTGISNNKLHRK